MGAKCEYCKLNDQNEDEDKVHTRNDHIVNASMNSEKLNEVFGREEDRQEGDQKKCCVSWCEMCRNWVENKKMTRSGTCRRWPRETKPEKSCAMIWGMRNMEVKVVWYLAWRNLRLPKGAKMDLGQICQSLWGKVKVARIGEMLTFQYYSIYHAMSN